MLNGMITLIHLKGDPEKINNMFEVSSMLKDIVRAIDMTPHGDVMVKTYPDDSNAAGTYTMFQCLHESFIAYDNWPELGYAHIIIDSCKAYDVKKVVPVIEKRGFKVQVEKKVLRYSEDVFKEEGGNGREA